MIHSCSIDPVLGHSLVLLARVVRGAPSHEESVGGVGLGACPVAVALSDVRQYTTYPYSHPFTSWDERVWQPKTLQAQRGTRPPLESHFGPIQPSPCLGGCWAGEKKCAPMLVPVDIVRAVVSVCGRATLPRGTPISSFP
eukprot:6198060-Pleurochrysis_carterae.AAC.1